MVVLPGEGMLQVVGRRVNLMQFFGALDQALYEGARALIEPATVPGFVGLDLSSLAEFLAGSSLGAMAIGHGEGAEREIVAARDAIESPMLARPLREAGRVLLQVRGGADLITEEIVNVGEIVQESARSDAKIVWGANFDPTVGGNVTVTIIATGFDVARPLSPLVLRPAT